MIGIFAALGRELKPIKALFPDLDEFRESGFLFSTGHLNRSAAVLVQTGIGFQRAASAAKIAADRFPLKLYVSTGFAGGLRNSIQVGDLVIAQKIISLVPTPAYPSPAHPVSGYPASERGRLGSGGMVRQAHHERHPELVEGRTGPTDDSATHAPMIDPKIFTSDPEWTRSAQKAAEKAAGRFLGGIHLGSIATVRKIAGRPEDKKAVANKTDAAALDMESAAVAGVAEERRAPFIAVRAVSDVLEEAIEFDGSRLLADDGAFQWGTGIPYLLTHPAIWGHLNRLRRQTNLAARSLGVYFQEFFLVSPGGALVSPGGAHASPGGARPSA